ncbi:Kinesin light chain 3 [Chytriomyces hyalinus]|nr:Kinesin light chain 3 [Chytriomyces hyalinus]
MMRGKVQISPEPPTIDPLSILGLPFSHFHTLINQWGGHEALARMSTSQVCEKYVKPMTRDGGKSLCETYAESCNTERQILPAKADWFVSHSWGSGFLDAVEALQDFFTDKKLDFDTTIVWFDLFSNPQHNTSAKPFEWWKTTFMEAVKDIGNVVMILQPWQDPVPLKRTWCVYELYACHVTKSKFEFAITRAEKEAFLKWLPSHVEGFFMQFHDLTCSRSQATKKSDRKAIFEVIKSSIGFLELDLLVLTKVRAWVRNQIRCQQALSEDREMWREVQRQFTEVENAFDEAFKRVKKVFGHKNANTLRFGSRYVGAFEQRQIKREKLVNRLTDDIKKERRRKWTRYFNVCGTRHAVE